jgi:hypothetical protein
MQFRSFERATVSAPERSLLGLDGVERPRAEGRLTVVLFYLLEASRFTARV